MGTIDSTEILDQLDGDIFDLLPVMVTVTEPAEGPGTESEPIIEDCNERFLERLRYRREDVIERPMADFYTAKSAAQMRDGDYERARRGEMDRAERRLVASDGGVIDTIVRTIPRRENSTPIGVVAVYVDVTEQRRREEHVQVLNRVMRHNVRNDLNVLAGHAEILADIGGEETADSVAVIRRLIDRWTALTEKAKYVEMMFNGTQPYGASVKEVVLGAQTAVELLHTDATVRTEIDVDPDLAVPNCVNSAVRELCENGVKHAGSDEPTVTVRAHPGDREGWVAISVADHGPGIPTHERTFLAEGEETPLIHGSGLGFWLVRMVARRVGGRVEVCDCDPTGSVVTLHVPVPAGATHGK